MNEFDPNIILGAKQPEDPQIALQRAWTLRNLAQQNAAGKLGLQGEQLKLSQLQQSIQDQRTMNQIGIQSEQQRNAQQVAPAGPPMDLSAIQPGATAPGQTQMQRPRAGMGDPMAEGMDRVHALRARGLGQQADALQTQLIADQDKMATAGKNTAEAGKFTAETIQKHVDAMASASGALLNVPPEQRPAAYQQSRKDLISQGIATADQLPPQYPGDQWLYQQHDAGIQAKDQLEQHLKAAEEARKAAKFPSELAASQAEATSKGIDASQKTSLGMTEDQSQTLQLRAKEIAKLNSPAQLAYQAENPSTPEPERQAARAALKILEQHAIASRPVNNTKITMGADSGVLTSDDYKRAGAEFAITGVMPQLGNGSGQVKQRLLHEKMQFSRDNNLSPREMALAKSAFAGDSKSLSAMVTQRDQIATFENTASKNLDLFLNAASKIPDTGVPWLNTPVRMLDEKMVGSTNMAAVNAARAVATNEIAKVTSGGGLGGVLSDAAKKEVKDYNPANATFKQTLAVAKILKSDMASRHTSMDNTISMIRDRAGTFNPPTDTTGDGAKKVEKWSYDSKGNLVKQ